MIINEKKEVERYFDIQEGLISFHNQFNYESNDRAIVVVGLAFIEDQLLYCLESFLPKKSSTVEKILSHRGFLGTYSAKVDLLYCLGFIDKMIKTDLDGLGQIRNLFAHKVNISFKHDQVIKICNEFKWYKTAMMMNAPEGATSKEIFKVEVNNIVSHLSGIASICRGEKRQLKN